MKNIVRKVKEGAGSLFCPFPSLFDFCVAVFLIMPFITDDTIQKIVFVFYTIFLICLSMGLTPQRKYKSAPLMLFALWALIGVFIHSFVIYKESITYKYLNLYLLSEGFIYIFFGILFLITAINYSTNLKFLYLLFPIALIRTFRIISKGVYIWDYKNFTFLGAVGIAVIVYLILNKKAKYTILPILVAVLIAKWQWFHVQTSLFVRPRIWKALIVEIFKHPFVGAGFDKFLIQDSNMVSVRYLNTDNFYMIYRHNDYLNTGTYLGVIATILAVWFAVETLTRMRNQPQLMLVLFVILTCFFQSTMFYIDKAAIYLIIGVLAIQTTIKKEAT